MGNLELVAVVVVVALSFVFYQRRAKTPAAALPPGPRPLPLLGNIYDLPPTEGLEYTHWLKHRQKYGPITSVTVMGQTIVTIHDQQMAIDILEKKSLKTSSRPWTEFASALCGFGKYTSAVAYNETLRLHRKLMHQLIGTKALVEGFQDAQEFEVSRMLRLIMHEPTALFDHLQLATGASIIRITYGYSIDTKRPDPVLGLVTRMMVIFNQAAIPGAWLVDVLPALKYLPHWLPWAGFKKTARAWRVEVLAAAERPFEFVKRQIEANRHRKSYVSRALENAKDSQDPDYESGIKFSAASLYGGGSDTTVSALSFFYLAMIKYPEVLQKAHEEIERVVGSDRLPNFDDRPNLPYVADIIKEVYRWQPVVPMGLPHRSDEDLVYMGHLIPNGSLIGANIRWFAYDPDVYHEPGDFKPERYQAPYNEPDPKEFVFGFGRRICPGRYFADSFLYLSIVQSLASFDIRKGVDPQGHEVEPLLHVLPGVLSRPAKFPFQVVPRNEGYKQLLEAGLETEILDESDAELFNSYGLASMGLVGK